jgi:hypothetical protein
MAATEVAVGTGVSPGWVAAGGDVGTLLVGIGVDVPGTGVGTIPQAATASIITPTKANKDFILDIFQPPLN